ncbi:cilia- and flagella-associated protein 157-like [Parasteatoda tepidariorum]|uniref:cilia- and flagella-associated protein 157-like n=1 Tax=Parasteatoda tepidariorum TaxID=114398 RepID=UPI00077FB768|nr:probable DNA double-strand break repair Rad50 ATPase [Parasteatoda tepidariorum]
MNENRPKRSDTLGSSLQEADGEGPEDAASLEKGKRRRLRRPPTQGSRRTKSTASSQDELTKETTTVESDPRDILENRVKELEMQLEQVEDHYVNLTEEVKIARSQSEVEQEDYEDIVSVAKRNVQKTVSKILEKQDRKRELQSKMGDTQEEVFSEERQRKRNQAKEEEALIRNIVILQTKILILEGKKSERDRILSKISEAEKELSEMDERHDKSLQETKSEMIEKFEKICYELRDPIKALSNQISQLSQSQQVAALKQRTLYILETRYKQASSLLLKIYDDNKELREKAQSLKRELNVSNSLAQAMSVEVKKTKQELTNETAYQKKDSKDKDVNSTTQNNFIELQNLKKQIKDLETRCFGMLDYKQELNEILSDQRQYITLLEEKEEKQRIAHEKMSSMSKVAENFLLKQDDQEIPDDILDHSDFLESMSNLLMEAVESKNIPESCISSSSSAFYEKGFIGLIPKRN